MEPKLELEPSGIAVGPALLIRLTPQTWAWEVTFKVNNIPWVPFIAYGVQQADAKHLSRRSLSCETLLDFRTESKADN